MQYCITTEELNRILSNLITDEEEDDEEVYKMAGVMAQCGGLECMLNRLSGIKDFKQGRHLLTVSQLLSVWLTQNPKTVISVLKSCKDRETFLNS